MAVQDVPSKILAPKMANDILWGQISQIPPITRHLSLAIAVTTLLIYMEAISPYSLFYSPLYLRKLEFWRIATCFLYFGRPTLDVLMHIVFLYRYSRMLEEGCMNTSDYFWLVVVISAILFTIANIFSIPTLGASFSSTITYIWTKRNPRAIVQIFGFISFPAFYLPFILPGFMLLAKKSILVEDLLGIIVGHLFYYFRDVYPRWGYDVLRTPCLVKKLFGEHSSECRTCRKPPGRGVKIGPAKEKRASESSSRMEDGSGMAHSVTSTSGMVEDNDKTMEAVSNGSCILATNSVANTTGIADVSNVANNSEADGSRVSSSAAGLLLEDEGIVSTSCMTPGRAEDGGDKEEWDDTWVVDSSDEDEQ
jgi:Derlin-2/3